MGKGTDENYEAQRIVQAAQTPGKTIAAPVFQDAEAEAPLK